jgi:hypothetical protein
MSIAKARRSLKRLGAHLEIASKRASKMGDTKLALAILQAQEHRDEINGYLDISEAALRHPKPAKRK